MTTNYIQVAPGTTDTSITLSTSSTVTGQTTGNLVVPSLQEVTINNSNAIFSWTQLNESAKLQIATVSDNSIGTSCVVEPTTFFGDGGVTSQANAKGLLGLSVAKTKCAFLIRMGTKVVTGNCYVTGLAPKVTADQPVWITPVTLTVSGDYTFA